MSSNLGIFFVNEINFVREQQKTILQIYPNTRKKDYSDSSAQKEIDQKLANLEKLKQLDFGFEDSGFTQVFFEGDKKLESYFTRKIICRFFYFYLIIITISLHFLKFFFNKKEK